MWDREGGRRSWKQSEIKLSQQEVKARTHADSLVTPSGISLKQHRVSFYSQCVNSKLDGFVLREIYRSFAKFRGEIL